MNETTTNSQQQAIAAGGNVLVVAGAGTGKTHTLVQRCLARLDDGESLENILMVTFTEAAAAEMRQRIGEALRRKVEQASGRCREHLKLQLDLLDQALISTLHSFCLQLVREHFFELEIDPEITVLDELQTQPLIRQTLDLLFERHLGGESERSRAVQALVRNQARGSEAGIRALVLKLHRHAQSLADPAHWLAEQAAGFAQAEPTQWREWLLEAFQSWRVLWLPVLREQAGTADVDRCREILAGVADRLAIEDATRILRSVLAVDDRQANRPSGSGGRGGDAIKEFFRDAEFLVSLTRSNTNDPLAEDWDWVRHPMATLIELVTEFSAEFARAKRELGGVDFADLEQFALRVLRDTGTGGPSRTAQAWRARLHHVFVDEYQDINAAQDAILAAVSREGSAANRFLVGDVKQSIYRFRQANPGIFRDYEQRWREGDPHAQRIPLTDNFRSREILLDFINPLFATLMRPGVGGVAYEPLRFGNADARAPLTRRSDTRPRTELHLIFKGSPAEGEVPPGETDANGPDPADLPAIEREARLVALRLIELKRERHWIWDDASHRFRPVTWSDMVVLMRSPAGRAEAFAKEFGRLGVPLEAARGGFFQSIEISDLVSLLRLIDNPQQDIPLLAVLRSPLVGMSIDELAEIRTAEPKAGFWLALRRFHHAGNRSTPSWRKADRFLRQWSAWRRLSRQTSLSHCLDTALSETHYEELLLAEPRGEARAANVRRLLDLARQYDPYQRQGLFRFLRFVEAQEDAEIDLEPAPAHTTDAVRLMSIHKSKGLESPVVVLAGLGTRFNLQGLSEEVLLDERYGICPRVAPPAGEQHYPSLPWWLARQRQRRELLGEELRLLYVAVTRARDTLILTGSTSSRADPKWPQAKPRVPGDQEVLSARCYFDWLKLWLPSATQGSDWNGDRDGQSNLLRWTLYLENDSRLAGTPAVPEPAPAGTSVAQADPAFVARLIDRVTWQYPFAAAVEERAKTTVSELRRRGFEEEEEVVPARFVQPERFQLRSRIGGALTAAEIGTAHHRFLQAVSLTRVGSVTELRSEAARLQAAELLSDAEVSALDLDALARFWESEPGQRITANATAVRRELPFTARFSPGDLQAAGPSARAGLAREEYVVVQGVIDLAVLLPDEIWLLDFKTDRLKADQIEARAREYDSQLRLYARALERIYGRRATNCWLHFLSAGQTVEVIP